jgi:YVTN family beta-propeller protein
MSFRRVGRLAAMVVATLLCVGCGQVYRPVVIPCSQGGVPGCPVETPPTPANFHSVFAITSNVVNYPGGAMQIDVSGDSIIGQTPTSDLDAPNLGDNPTHAASIPSNSRVFVASAGSVLPGGVDVVSSFAPASQFTIATGLGAVNNIGLPAGSQPVFLNTTQNNVLYVANFGTNSVMAINTNTNVVTNTASVGVNPVALAETPNALKLYVANQGDNSISSLNVADLSLNTVTGFSGMTPVWAVARGDSQKVYVLTQGDGQLVTIDVATDTVTSSLPVGAGANFIFFDPNLNRLYVTNPSTGLVYVFSDTGGANDTPTPLTPNGLALPGLSAATPPPLTCPGCGTAVPVSVTALPDGSRFYVASYQVASPCPDPNVTVSPCIIPGLTVFDAMSLTPEITPALTLLTWSPSCAPTATQCPTGPFAANQFAVPPVATCATAAVYSPSPSFSRFRVFTVAAADSSAVYVSMCDAGAIAVINTTDDNTNGGGGSISADSLVVDLPAAFSAGPAQPNGFPANQNPIFMLTGQ